MLRPNLVRWVKGNSSKYGKPKHFKFEKFRRFSQPEDFPNTLSLAFTYTPNVHITETIRNLLVSQGTWAQILHADDRPNFHGNKVRFNVRTKKEASVVNHSKGYVIRLRGFEDKRPYDCIPDSQIEAVLCYTNDPLKNAAVLTDVLEHIRDKE